MENVMDYVCMALLFMVFRTTMLVDCELFDELPMKEVRQETAKRFLRLRRIRVGAGQVLLVACSVRFIVTMVVIPMVNGVCALMQSDVRYRMTMAITGELWITSGVCTLLLIIYMIETRLKKRMIKEWEDAGV